MAQRTIPRFLLLGATLGACAFGLAMAVLAVRANAIDLMVYRAGGEAVLESTPLYNAPVFNDMRFTYPPFAAILFVPIALFGPAIATAAVAIGNSALLVYISVRCWRSAGQVTGTKLLALSLVTASLLLATETVHATLYVGQINFVLMALIFGDLLRDDAKLTKGIGLGIAAGIKLTPLIFVAYLVVTKRFRAALVATATFCGTVALGFLVLPGDSAKYWFEGTFGDVSRIYQDVYSTHNQSLRGLLLRELFDNETVGRYWLPLAVLLACATFAVARLASNRGEELLALTLVGMCGAALSPWSWGHHWGWLLPLAVFLGSLLTRGIPVKAWWLPAALIPFTFPWVLALADPPDAAVGGPVLASGPLAVVVGNLYLLILLVTLVITTLRVRSSATPVPESR